MGPVLLHTDRLSSVIGGLKEVKVNESSVISHLETLGIDPKKARRIELIYEGHGNRLYRILWDANSSVLKLFKDATEATEIHSYELLQRLKVPTLPVYGHT